MMTARSLSFTRTLGALLADDLPAAAQAWADRALRSLCIDSRRIQAGDAFLALSSARAFVPAAIASGAAAVLVEAEAGDLPFALQAGVPVLAVTRLSQRLGELANRFYDHPSQALRVTGVTGTNGKTTVSHLAARLCRRLGESAGVIGTLGWGLDEALNSASHTTPDAISLQTQLASLRDAGAKQVFMEVSSHALVQDRLQGVQVQTAVFTNLSRDHLDYHGDMAAYGAAKALLFQRESLRHAVLNADDAFVSRLAAQLPASVQCLRYGLAASADVRASAIATRPDGLSAHIHTPWGEGELHSPLLGRFNLSNLLAVIALAGIQGWPLDAVLTALAEVPAVRGRLERVADARGVHVVIDYAHTPDALDNALQTVREHTQGALHVVFGCGGNRDAGKRPLMGAVAERGADRIWLTSDNPRHENPQAILQAVVAGFRDPGKAVLMEDRAEAIATALAAARAGDTVLIAGKGHETTQQIGDEIRPFSDHAAVQQALRAEGLA